MTEWHERWDEGRIGFHREEVNPWLAARMDALGEPGRVLVPLCGKTVDLTHLAEAGFAPVGVELVEKAAVQYFEDRGLEAERDGDVFRGGGVEIVVGDILEWEPEAKFDAIWDRAAMVALPPDVRPRYAERMLEWLRPGGSLLLLSFTYDQEKAEGPPWSVSDDEVRGHYAAHGALEELAREVGEGPPKFDGLELAEVLWRLERA
jgi:thiopurine S-methyltransferase